MITEDVKKDIINRLHTVQGHIGGIEKMIEEGKSCDDVLLQIAAVKSSIEKIGYFLLQEHAAECIIKDDKDKVMIDDVKKLINSVIKFTR